MNKQNLNLIHHPLIAHKLTIMRDKSTTCLAFKQLLHEITLLMGYELTKDLPLGEKTVTTPVTTAKFPVLQGKRPVIIPILRAGLGMSEPLSLLLPDAEMGHIGVYRDEQTRKPVEYLVKLPEDVASSDVILVDPMLATGGSASYSIDVLNNKGVDDKHIKLMVLVAAPEGVEHLANTHPEVKVYTAALDEKLNTQAFIHPGLGDAGDRIFGTL